MGIELILLGTLVVMALWTVMTVRLIRAIIGLALVSAVLSIVMFRLSSGLAAVFELSVCAGLISVIFITTVSFTQRISKEQLIARKRERILKFWYLPFLILVVFIFLLVMLRVPAFELPVRTVDQDVRNVLWNLRHLDLIGQVVILLAGAFGVVVLFKEERQ
jgi:NADH-quinone oxidoreductase subunit J